MPNSHAHHVETKSHPHADPSLGSRAVHAVTEVASAAQAGASRATTRTQELVRDHPMVSVGVSLATGALIGAVAYKLLAHKQTFSEALAERLGLDRARNSIRRWL